MDNLRFPRGLQTWTILIGALSALLGLFSLWVFWAFFLNYIDNYELGYRFDNRTGQITVYDHPGYIIETPYLVSVHSIDLRPIQVCITAGYSGSVNQRVLNCKLVQFDKRGLDTFVAWHGRGDYSNYELKELLKIYAYDENSDEYPFLKVLKELEAKGAGAP